MPEKNFEGSVEVEVFAIRNMRIPYAAIMAVYECKDSISMVHSYTRTYSQHEIEEGRTITLGEESCWTLRDSEAFTSFAVIHNGSYEQVEQTVIIRVRSHSGAEAVADFKLPKLSPYQTFIFEPKKYLANLIAWLDGKPGNARISFELNGSFTRLLCGIKNVELKQLQVMHSNFDYSTHATDTIGDDSAKAYMRTPNLQGNITQEIVVYPDTDEGNDVWRSNQKQSNFSTGQIYTEKSQSASGQLIQFERADGILPSRIVTGLRLNSGLGDILPAECSLGVIHKLRPKKNFAWMLVSGEFNSQISWVVLRKFMDAAHQMPNSLSSFIYPSMASSLLKL